MKLTTLTTCPCEIEVWALLYGYHYPRGCFQPLVLAYRTVDYLAFALLSITFLPSTPVPPTRLPSSLLRHVPRRVSILGSPPNTVLWAFTHVMRPLPESCN